MKRFLIPGAGIAGVLALALASPAAAVLGTLDANQTSTTDAGYAYTTDNPTEQTFTVGLTGTLTGVSVYVGVSQIPEIQVVPAAATPATPPPGASMGVFITATSSGTPVFSGESDIKADAFVTGTADPGWIDLAITPPLSVTSGTQLGLGLTAAPGYNVSWFGVCGSDPYAGGEAWVDVSSTWETVVDYGTSSEDDSLCDTDFAFKTWIDPLVTAPPTSTLEAQSTGSGANPAILLVLATAGIAGAYVMRRRMLMNRR